MLNASGPRMLEIVAKNCTVLVHSISFTYCIAKFMVSATNTGLDHCRWYWAGHAVAKLYGMEWLFVDVIQVFTHTIKSYHSSLKCFGSWTEWVCAISRESEWSLVPWDNCFCTSQAPGEYIHYYVLLLLMKLDGPRPRCCAGLVMIKKS